MKINIIAAVDPNNVIGVDNRLPWHISEDLKRFKELTLGNVVVMGRRTWESLPLKPLPGRTNIVLSRQSYEDLKLPPGVIHAESLQAVFSYCRLTGVDEIFVIGGEKVYYQALPNAHRIYLTRVNTYVGDEIPGKRAYFPPLPARDWGISAHTVHSGHTFTVLDRVGLG